jgi:translation initiation factor IF-1
MGKGHITAGKRKEINNRTVTEAMNGDSEDIFFGRVLKHLGNGHVRVILPNKREGIAKIRSALTKRGTTPIVTDDIVVLSGREFETKSAVGPDGRPIEKVEKFDLLGVLSRAQAGKMEKEGKIPAWFVASEDGSGGDGDNFVFDYTAAEEGEVNVDDL